MKKLLLILLCLPMIGFAQDDKIIFSSGDTIYGKVIEVGENDITYQHKDETTNNITKSRKIATIIYASGRVQNLKGFKIRKKRKIIVEPSLEIGAVFGLSSNNSTVSYEDPFGGYEIISSDYNDSYKEHMNFTTLGNITMTEGVSIRYTVLNWDELVKASINTKIIYHISGYTRTFDSPENWDEFVFEDFIDPQYGLIIPAEWKIPDDAKTYKHEHSDHYITLPMSIQFNIKSFFGGSCFVNGGGYFAYLLKTNDNFSDFFNPEANRAYGSTGDIIDNRNNIDLGLTFGFGLDYSLNSLWDVNFEFLTLYGKKDYYNTSEYPDQWGRVAPLSGFYKYSNIGLFGLIYKLK